MSKTGQGSTAYSNRCPWVRGSVGGSGCPHDPEAWRANTLNVKTTDPLPLRHTIPGMPPAEEKKVRQRWHSFSGETLAWAFFLATTVHLAFLQPYVVLIPGERANVFSGMLCAISLLLALVMGEGKRRLWRSSAAWCSLALLLLVVLSGLLGDAPETSLIRGFVIASAGLGGFWGARLLLQTEGRRIVFARLCLVLLSGLVILAVVGAAVSLDVARYLDSHWHPVGARVLLLSFGPLALLGSGSRATRVTAMGLLVLGYGVLLLLARHHGMESVVMIPPILFGMVMCLRKWSRRTAAVMLGLVLITSVGLFNQLHRRAENLGRGHESVAYRVENIFFSWEIAMAHPFLGIGLWAPRDAYLERHEIRYSHVTKEEFSRSTLHLRTSENSVLTFLADLGFPFTILYGLGVAALVLRVVWMTLDGSRATPFHPLALLVPIVGEILHLQVCDALFQPQVSWFFHVLLGMIPAPRPAAVQAEVRWRDVAGQVAAVLAMVVLGALLATRLPMGTFLDWLL
jgi:hypothetical protein